MSPPPKEPLVSVIMTAFNAEEFIEDAIKSILCQTFEDLELIIVDDGSNDNTVGLITAFSDNRIRFLKNGTNKGQSFSRNQAIKLATGLYIAIMDADDIAYSYRITTQYDYLQLHPNISFCCSGADLIDSDNMIFGRKQMPDEEKILRLKLLFECPIIHPTVMWRKADFKVNNLWYDEYFVYAQDYDLWSRALECLKLGIIHKPLIKFRFHHPKSVSRSKRKIQTKYAHIISRRNLRRIIKISDIYIKISQFFCEAYIYRLIVRSEYLVDDKKLKVKYFRGRLFDGYFMPYRVKKYLRRIIIN